MIDMEHRLTQVEDGIGELSRRQDEMEKRQDDLDELVSTVKVLAVREEAVESDVKEIKSDVKELTGKSGKKWENLGNQIITIITGAVVGYFLAQIGIS